MEYDSEKDTLEHIKNVRILLGDICSKLLKCAELHDASKLQSPEKEIFDEFTPKLKASTYGSDEYKGFLKQMGEALEHHYANNSHHPEHYPDGMRQMNIIDLIEMFCDWKAATLRHADGDLFKSIEINRERFGMPDMLVSIFKHSATDFGW